MTGAVAWLAHSPGREQSVCGHCFGDGVVPGGRDGITPCTPCRGFGDPPLGTPPFRDVDGPDLVIVDVDGPGRPVPPGHYLFPIPGHRYPGGRA